jgi:putative transcriptional regulator
MKKPRTETPKQFRRSRKLTDADVLARAKSDPDNPPLSATALAGFLRISIARRVRLKLGLSQAEFAKAFGIPVGTLRDWEQHRTEPDKAARSYLAVIAADPTAVRKALKAA